MENYRHESAATQRLFDRLTDASLAQAVAADHRTIGRIAWHLATMPYEMPSLAGLALPVPCDVHQAPASAAVIADTFRQSTAALLAALPVQWTDATLAETRMMYGQVWPNGLMLHLLIAHEIHHRGQLTVLMRQAGLRVPDMYGPVYEDWAERGIAAPVV
ncbi:DinB family protein [Paenibacillus athensensis]|uniref:DinB family protein n=1 Tax=Paenibacillus athensensis TaxID=1967502 RepID=UPI001E49B987|nr:DinB family protein [Paenibacillus athensensis]